MATLNIQVKQYLQTHYIANYDTYKSIHVSFIPDETINCNPPYIKGKKDSAWIKLNNQEKLDTSNKRQCESLVGIKLQSVV